MANCDNEMIVMEKEIAGFPGTKIRCDGVVIGKRGIPLKQPLRNTYNRVGLMKDGKQISESVHRLVALAFVPNPRPDLFKFVDHIDGNRRNNHYTNLRWVTRQLNGLNQKSKYCKPTKGCISKPFQALGQVNGKQTSLGMYSTEAEAIKVMNDHREKLFNNIYNWHTRPMTGKCPFK